MQPSWVDLFTSLSLIFPPFTYSPQGLLLPLCQSRTCSLREAFIFSSVLRRTSIPVLHSAAALLRMAQVGLCIFTTYTLSSEGIQL